MQTSKLVSLVVLTALLVSGSPIRAHAAVPIDAVGTSDALLMAQLRQQDGGSPRILRHAETGKIRFMSFAPGRALRPANTLAATTTELAARAFLSSYGPLFGVRDQARELRLMRQEALPGREFARFQQVYQGIPVLAGELVVQADPQHAIVSVNGEALPDLAIPAQPAVGADAAAQIALEAVGRAYDLAPAELRGSAPRLWIYNPALLGGPGARATRLVWRVEVTPAGAAGRPIRELVLVDAQIGTVALHFNQIADARQRGVCDNQNAVDPDGDPNNNCIASAYARSEGQAPTGDQDVDLAYDYAGIAYDYFLTHFGRDSLDGKGLPLISLVRYCTPGDTCPYQNAFWTGQQMTYGQGFASADDVVGHELTHGFTEFTSNLLYYYQSGAINESLSDVFGELIDLSDGRGNDSTGVRWLIGEDLPASFGVIRNMANPAALPLGVPGPYFTVSPDRMTSPNYALGSADSGGVHTNSGVNNKAAYLMTDGGSFNGYTIAGLGAAKVGAIYYTLEVAFLTSGSDYQDLASELPAACAALAATGAYGIVAGDCDQVQRAVKATEMELGPTGQTLAAAPICPAGQSSQDVFYDDLETPATGNWAVGALQGPGAWRYPIDPATTYATSGKQALWGQDPGQTSDSAIAMTRDIAVPAQAYMHFRHAFDLEADSAQTYDGGVVEYSTDGGQGWHDAGALFSDNGYNRAIDGGSANPLHGRDVFSATSAGYTSSRLDLSALAGQTARFRFRIGSDQLNRAAHYGWFIDDIRIYTCSSAAPAVVWRASSARVPENAGSIVLPIGLSGATDKTILVPIGVAGTASPTLDYSLSASAVSIPAGAAAGSLTLTINDDLNPESDETVVLTLQQPANATLGATSVVTITIAANDADVRQAYLPLVVARGTY